MAETYAVLIPVIGTSTFSSNPCSINEKITITVTVTEQTVMREPEIIYSGEVFAGEVK